jgi:glycosyltransferase involved in cell wall biosynthesis
VRVVDLRAPRVIQSLLPLTRYLRRERPVSVLSVMSHSNLIALWARRLAGVPTRLVVCEQNTPSQNALHPAVWRGRLVPHLMRRFYSWADAIVAVSDGVADDVVRITGLPRRSIEVVYNPVVTPELRAAAEAPLEHPWFQAGQPPVVLAVGRLRPQKDFPTLIRAFARMRRKKSARLLILGEGSERPRLEALVREHALAADVQLPGFDANPYRYLARGALFVLSSAWEGLPSVLIEALACGLRVVATDCPSGPREILRGGRYGELVPVGDSVALADAIENALSGPTARPPEEAWRPYGIEAVLDRYEQILLYAMNRGSEFGGVPHSSKRTGGSGGPGGGGVATT